jgi:phage regulator Rha-like protein
MKHSTVPPSAFTEKGLYMLATILKSGKATQVTLAIIEAFAKLRELSRAVAELAETKDKNAQKSLMEQSGEIMSELLYGGLEETDTETSLEINLALMKFKHIVKRKKK